MPNITNEQISAASAVLGDNGKPIGRNTAIMVADALAWASAARQALPVDAAKAELIERLQDYAANSGYSHNDYADTMREAANQLNGAFFSIGMYALTLDQAKSRLGHAEDRIDELESAAQAQPAGAPTDWNDADQREQDYFDRWEHENHAAQPAGAPAKGRPAAYLIRDKREQARYLKGGSDWKPCSIEDYELRKEHTDIFEFQPLGILMPAAAQPAGAGAQTLDTDEMTRLRRLIHALGMDGSMNASDEQVRGLLFTALGQAVGKLERTARQGAAPAQAEPMALLAKWKGYPLPEFNDDGNFDWDWLHREWVAFQAGLSRATAPAHAGVAQAYVTEIGEAGQRYHESFKFAHPLPVQWRWQDLWEAMNRAAIQASSNTGSDSHE